MSTRQRTAAKTVQPQPPEAVPTIVEPAPFMGTPKQRVRITKTEQSFSVGGAHYTLRAGDVMSLDAAVASSLIQSGRAVAEG